MKLTRVKLQLLTSCCQVMETFCFSNSCILAQMLHQTNVQLSFISHIQYNSITLSYHENEPCAGFWRNNFLNHAYLLRFADSSIAISANLTALKRLKYPKTVTAIATDLSSFSFSNSMYTNTARNESLLSAD